MGISDHSPIRYNKEYFGYLVGYPDGRILLVNADALPVLERNGPFEELAPYELRTLDIREPFHLHTPPLVWLELTKRCNLKCPHCYIDGGKPRAEELSDAEIHRLIDEMADMGVWAIAFTGGEPTLHPSFVDFVRHARERDVLVGIATHGLHLSDELLAQLPRDGVIISVSIDDLHIPGRDIEREFRMAARTLQRCKAHGFPGNIMTNTNRRNVDRLDDMIVWAEEHGVSVRSVPFSPIGERAKKNRAWLENVPADVPQAAAFWMKEVEWEHAYHREVGLCVGQIFNYGLTLAFMTDRCSSGRYLCYVCADGTLYPCTMCAGEKILSPGSVKGRSFAEAWRSHWPIRDSSWAAFEDTCTGCPLHNDMFYCSSRCPAMSHARHGDLTSCGASDFEKVSLIVRTAQLQHSPIGQAERTTP